MIAARLTTEEAKRLGIGVPPGRGRAAGRARVRTTKHEAGGPYRTRCVACRIEFTTMASEDRHVTETGHARYELVDP
jgi:hypothetical protein